MSARVYVCVDVHTQKHTHVYVFVCLHNMCAFVSFTNESGLQRNDNTIVAGRPDHILHTGEALRAVGKS